MIEIFPGVSSCCFCISVRMGMLYISVYAVMTGVFGLIAIVNDRSTQYEDLYKLAEIYKNLTRSTEKKDIVRNSNILVKTLFSVFSMCFMCTGLMLFFGTLFKSEGLVNAFVWVTLLNVLLGFLMLAVTSVECVIYDDTCLFTNSLDWLSGAFLVLSFVGCLFMWIYFIVVANTYLLEEEHLLR